MIQEKDIKAIGKFQKTHALKGELNAILDIDPDFLTEGNALVIETEGIYVPFYATGIRPKGNTSFLIKLDGIDTEVDARKIVNKTIFALKSELAPFLDLEEEDIRDEDDLVGYKIQDKTTGKTLGNVVRLDSSTSNVLFIVEGPDKEEIFIPAVEEFIYTINDDEKYIIMDLPEGLIDLN